MKCIICDKEFDRCFSDPEFPEETSAWSEAVVDCIIGGYGSRHDMCELIVGICDDCLDKKIQEGTIIVRNTLDQKLEELSARRRGLQPDVETTDTNEAYCSNEIYWPPPNTETDTKEK